MKKLKFLGASFNSFETRPPCFNAIISGENCFVDFSNNCFVVKQEEYNEQLKLMFHAKSLMDRQNHDEAEDKFIALLCDSDERNCDVKLPFELLPKEMQTIYSQAIFFRGVCRYQQVNNS